MSGRTFGVPAALDEHTRVTVPSLLDVAVAVEELREAVAALAAAGSDIEVLVPDRSELWRTWIDTTRMVDELPAAVAEALRAIDGTLPAFAGAPGCDQPPTEATGRDDLRTHDGDETQVWALATERLRQPYATADQVMDAGSGGFCPPLPERSDRALLPWYWQGIATGNQFAGSAGSVPALPGGGGGGVWGADALRGVLHRSSGATPSIVAGSAVSPPRGWLRHALRLSGIASVGYEGVEQVMIDRHDPNLTAGDRVARVGARLVLDGGGGAIGTAAGAIAAVGTGPVVGFGVTLLGSVAGTSAGRTMRGSAPVQTAVDEVGAALDRLLSTGHDDDYDESILGDDR